MGKGVRPSHLDRSLQAGWEAPQIRNSSVWPRGNELCHFKTSSLEQLRQVVTATHPVFVK